MAAMWALVRKRGSFSWETDYPMPKLKPGYVLLRVRGAALNPADYKTPEAIMGPVVGIDVAGVVEDVGAGVSEFKVGDDVFGRALGTGSLAQFTIAEAGLLSRKPSSLTWAEAAALPTAYLTGLQALRDHAKITKGDRVLVIGASGGCGLAGLQLAKALGASEVVAVCSGANAELCREHGADRIVDYKTQLANQSLREILGPSHFDVVYDCATNSGAGENYKAQALAVLKQDRTLVSINASLVDWLRKLIACPSRRHLLFLTDKEGNPADLDFLVTSNIKPVFHEGFAGAPLNWQNVMKGFDLLKSRRAKGKIAFTVGVD